MIDLLVCAATEFEIARVRTHAETLVTGVGQVNAAIALTRYLARSRQEIRQIVVCGIGGAYPGQGLSIGDVACAETEVYGDLGAASPSGFLDLKALGFPLFGSVYNELPLNLFPHYKRCRFATVNCCTGTDASSDAMQRRTGAAVENMEGAAIVHVAAMSGIAVGEIRGISNFTGDRDRDSWRIADAANAVQQALITWIQTSL